MTVYVDDLRTPRGKALVSRMIASSLAELEDMASAIGAPSFAKQVLLVPMWHVTEGQRKAAIERGAVPVIPIALTAWHSQWTRNMSALGYPWGPPPRLVEAHHVPRHMRQKKHRRIL